MASILFTRFLACSAGMGLFIALMVAFAPHWSRFFAAKWSVWLWGVLAACLCLPLAPGIPAVERFFQRYSWITAAWLLIAVSVLACCFLRQHRFRKDALRWSAEPEKPSFALKTGRLAEELNLHKCPSVHITTRVSCPTILGLGDPVLLLPHENFSDTEFDIIIRHEFYHYLHGHIPYKVFLTVVCALHWFNPAVWMMRRKAALDLESACDDALLVNASDKTRRQYSETILSVMQSPSGCDTPFTTHTYGSPDATGRRLVRLVSAPPKTGGAALLCAAVILSFLSSTAVATATAKLEAPVSPVAAPAPDDTSSLPDPPVNTSTREPDFSVPDEAVSVPQEADSAESQILPDPEVSSPPPDESDAESSVSEPVESEPVQSASETEESSETAVESPPSETEEDTPEFPTEAAKALAETASELVRNVNQYTFSTSNSLQGIVIPGEKTPGIPPDDILITVLNRIVRAYNDGTADTSMSDPDAPRLMAMPASLSALPEITSPDQFTALPRTANGYSVALSIGDTGIQMQIWIDDNGPDDAYSFDVVAVSFARA